MKRTLITRLERIEAAQHDATTPLFDCFQLDEDRIGIFQTRRVRGPIPVLIMPKAPESLVAQESPVIELHDQPPAQTTDLASSDFNAMKNDGLSSRKSR